MFAFSATLLSTTINVLRADLYGVAVLNDLNMTGCRFQGMLLFETFGCCNISFVLQAIYRFVRVIYARHKYLQVRLDSDADPLCIRHSILDLLIQSDVYCLDMDSLLAPLSSAVLVA